VRKDANLSFYYNYGYKERKFNMGYFTSSSNHEAVSQECFDMLEVMLKGED
jgi:hypothetical protein